MFDLIKKDLFSIKKYILLLLFFNIFMPIFLSFDEDPTAVNLISFLLPAMSLELIIGKVCYMEDLEGVKILSESLLDKDSRVVKSRFFEMFILAVISSVYVSFVEIFFKLEWGAIKILEVNIAVIGCMVIYYSIYLYLYFKQSYDAVRNTVKILTALILGGIFLIRKGNAVQEQSLFNLLYIDILFMAAAFISYFSAIKTILKKDS